MMKDDTTKIGIDDADDIEKIGDEDVEVVDTPETESEPEPEPETKAENPFEGGSKKKKLKAKKKEEEEEEDEEDEDEEDDEDDEDEGGGSGKKILIAAIAIAALIAVASLIIYPRVKKSDEPAEETRQEQQEPETEPETEAETEAEAEPEVEAETVPEDVTEEPVVEEETPTPEPTDTPIPTSTPKPLPSATPTPSPFPEEDPYAESYGEQAGEPIGTPVGEDGQTAAVQIEPADVIFLGDLRFRSMANVVSGGSDLWECSSTGDYAWMTDTAFTDVEPHVGEGTKVFISVGLNDLYQSAAYATSINAKAEEWAEKGASVYFVAVGPVAETSMISNQDIMNFNTYMYQNLNVAFIDAYNYLVSTGFDTMDGQTYTDGTSQVLYNYLNGLIGR